MFGIDVIRDEWWLLMLCKRNESFEKEFLHDYTKRLEETYWLLHSGIGAGFMEFRVYNNYE